MTKIAFMASDAIALDSIRAVHAGADSELVCVAVSYTHLTLPTILRV